MKLKSLLRRSFLPFLILLCLLSITFSAVGFSSTHAASVSSPVAYWGFDGSSSNVATDTSGNGNNATINGATPAPGRSGFPNGSLAFNGTSSTVNANKPLLNTNSNFSISAWVKLSSLPGWATAVSQDGNTTSGFYLQYTSVTIGTVQGNKFILTMLGSDSTSATPVRVFSNFSPQIGVWYHLAGIHNSTTNQIALYVNGSLQATANVPPGWQAQGETVIGRAKWNGSPVDFWPGQIDDVGIYNRVLSSAEIATLAGITSATPTPTATQPPTTLHTSWGSPMQTLLAFSGSNFSCRWTVRSTIAGSSVRVRLSNDFGTTPLTFNQVTIGAKGSGPTISGSIHSLTFQGAQSVTIPPGGVLWSDLTGLSVNALEDLAVSTFIAGNNPPVSEHSTAFASSYCTDTNGGAGNHTMDGSGNAFNNFNPHTYWVSGLDVQTSGAGGSIVCFGDSITEGAGTGYDAHQGWVDILANRLVNQSTYLHRGVINSGIGGNTLNTPYGGAPVGLDRFNVDALNETGATNLILFIGTNDIGDGATGDQVIAAYKTAIMRAHQSGFKVIGATIIPRGWDNQRNIYRAQVNQWIRTPGNFDTFIDFDAVVRDPNNPNAMLSSYDYGDHIHPNPAGHLAMGNSIQLSIFSK